MDPFIKRSTKRVIRLKANTSTTFNLLQFESFQILAIKQVPVDTDLQEIIKEISIMQQCDSPYVVKYYGSYFKNTDLWVSLLDFFFVFNSFLMFSDHNGILWRRICL